MLLVYNDIKRSHVNRNLSKMQSNAYKLLFFLKFKMALYSSTFNSSYVAESQNYYCETEPNHLLNESLCIHPLTKTHLITEELRLVATARYVVYTPTSSMVSCLSGMHDALLLRPCPSILSMASVLYATKATEMWKSCKTCLTKLAHMAYITSYHTSSY